jgi:hypothetical protein
MHDLTDDELIELLLLDAIAYERVNLGIPAPADEEPPPPLPPVEIDYFAITRDLSIH